MTSLDHEYQLLKQEQLERSTIMIDLEDKQQVFYETLVIQYAWLTMFLAFFPLGALVAFISNLIMVSLTAKSYGTIIRRSASHHIHSIGVWKKIFSVLGYIGVVFNVVILLYPGGGLQGFLDSGNQRREAVYILVAEHLLLAMKFVLSKMIPSVPRWVKVKMKRAEHKAQKNRLPISEQYGQKRTGVVIGRMMSDQF